MSYSTWHDYGYGICTSNLKNEISVVRLMKLIQTAPKLYGKVKQYIEDCCDGQIMETHDLLNSYVENYGEINYGGLSEIMFEVIKEVEGIELLACTDFDGKNYLIYPPIYPWTLRKMSEKEQMLTEKDLEEIYSKYLKIVTDETLEADYQSVENGG